MKLYNIFYIDKTLGWTEYQATTNDPKKWFEQHNKNRIADGNKPEKLEYFDIKEIYLELFNK